MRYVLYARKPTDEEDRQILSIEAQVTEVKEYTIKENLQIVQELIESRSAKVPGRPIFNEMILLLEQGKADAILAWHSDMLARNSLDGGKIIYLIDKGIINDLKFPTYRFDNTAQGKFCVSKLVLILTNPFYYGILRYWGETFEATHEQIITKKLFEKCKQVMRQRGKPRKAKHRFIFRGFMKCGECGRMITAEMHKDYVYYRCTKRYTNCSQKYIREEALG